MIKMNMFGTRVDGKYFTTCEDISEMREWIERSNCDKCSFSKRRKLIVPGIGDGSSGLCIVGQGPGRMENLRGKPFVGKSGELLDKLLASIPYAPARETIYITNIVKCYGGRQSDGSDVPPRAQQINACLPYLKMEVKLLKPSLVLAFGEVAWRTLCPGKDLVNGSLIENTILGVPVFLSYHPAWALRKRGKSTQVLRNDVFNAIKELDRIKHDLHSKRAT